MITFDNSFFFKKEGLNFNNNSKFKKNLNISISESCKLLEEHTKGNNEILHSFTENYQKKIRKLKQIVLHKNKRKVVIGLGGSSSGAKALSFFIKDDIIYLDNIDYEYFKKFFEKENLSNFFFYIISKSGDTYETLAILNLLLKEGKKNKNYDIFESLVIITENKKSILKSFSEKNNLKFIEHNPKIGGRFSVLSETGMLPFLENNIIVEDASEKFLGLLKNNEDELSPAKNIAILLTCLQEFNLNIYCNLLYNYRLKHFSYWFYQLHAESLGKNGKGLTPITSICPKDHHSMMQLYLGGPRNKFFNLFSPPDETYFDKFDINGFYNIENYTPGELLERQFKAVIEVFTENKIPHRIIRLDNHKDPLNLIELFAYFLLETILFGKIIGINPYDQPAVQLIKDKIFKD